MGFVENAFAYALDFLRSYRECNSISKKEAKVEPLIVL